MTEWHPTREFRRAEHGVAPGPGEVLLEVHDVGPTRKDNATGPARQRGLPLAGRVTLCGADTDPAWESARVMALALAPVEPLAPIGQNEAGGNVLLPESLLLAIPRNIDSSVAASLIRPMLTAALFFRTLPLPPGSRLLLGESLASDPVLRHLARHRGLCMVAPDSTTPLADVAIAADAVDVAPAVRQLAASGYLLCARHAASELSTTWLRTLARREVTLRFASFEDDALLRPELRRLAERELLPALETLEDEAFISLGKAH